MQFAISDITIVDPQRGGHGKIDLSIKDIYCLRSVLYYDTVATVFSTPYTCTMYIYTCTYTVFWGNTVALPFKKSGYGPGS